MSEKIEMKAPEPRMARISKTTKIVALCSLANFVNAADRVIMPIAVVPMTKQFNWDLQEQGWVLSAFAFGYISSQIIGGRTAQHFGGKITLGFAVAVWSLATFMTPFIAPYLGLVIMSRVLLGFAEGFCLPTIYHIFSHTITAEERSRSFGYLVAAGSVGQTIAAVICPRFPWPMMFYSFGIIGMAWIVIWVLMFKESTAEGDTEMLLLPKVDTRHSATWSAFIMHRALWAIYSAHFAMNWSNYIILSWLPTYLTQLGANKNDISFTAIPYIMNSLVGVAAGHYADSLISKRQWTLLSVRRLMSTIGLLGPAVFILLFGKMQSVLLALCFVSISLGLCACNSAGHMSNHADVAPNHAGITFAISNTLATIPGITCGPVTAAIVSYTGSWYPVFVIAASVNLAGALIYNSQSSASQVL
ncbi:uncharacterized protein LOC100367151 [Saccoglossus kowalevskii]|uniref:Probable anion transporter 4, chloroplastic-like n=1 Tax=Saccoglossus kowalevskii TaxID=10224 RepID=A0ABM0H1Y4_SACKO|nr:PREDICTED: probable anion transporter 4, chloroplastic-like [Saccoglossus kowalevskii]